MKKYIYLFSDYYYFYLVAYGLINMLYANYLVSDIVNLTLFLFAIYQFASKRLKVGDILVLIYMTYCVCSIIINDNWHIGKSAIKMDMFPIAYYALARFHPSKANTMMDNMKWPLIFAMICGLYLYVNPPGWYTAWKMRNWTTEGNEFLFYERMRLSGFWPWSYWLGYGSLFFIMYQMKKYVFDNIRDKYFSIWICIAILVLFLAQQRVAIVYFFVYFVALTWFATRYNHNAGKLLIRIWLVIILGAVSIIFALNYIDESGLVEYVLNRSVNREDNLIEERFNLYKHLFNNISFWGDGMGQHSHEIFYMTGDHTNAITDCDYLRLLNEIGYMGFTILCMVILYSIKKGLKNIKVNFFELNIVGFLLVAMIGANPFELAILHSYIYWYAIGYINSGKNLIYK